MLLTQDLLVLESHVFANGFATPVVKPLCKTIAGSEAQIVDTIQ